MGKKMIRRKNRGTGRMQYEKDLPRQEWLPREDDGEAQSEGCILIERKRVWLYSCPREGRRRFGGLAYHYSLTRTEPVWCGSATPHACGIDVGHIQDPWGVALSTQLVI